MSGGRKVTEELARIIAETDFDRLPAEAVEVAKRIILDGIAVAVAGAGEKSPATLAAHLREMGGVEACTVIGMGFRTSPVSAAYLNGVSMHVLDFEPMWMPPTHATSPALPSVLALAETREAPGKEVIAAFAKGCEIQGRICLAAKIFAPGQLKQHPPGAVGTMGAAVAAAHLLGLGEEGLRNAMGLAASRAGSLVANIGTMTKSTHCGLAGAMGLDAALLAARGFTANPDIFEAAKGYVEVFFPWDFDYDALLAFGRPYRMVDPGFAIKLFPAQYPTHFGITAALEVHEQMPADAGIRSVTITTPVMPHIDRPAPKTGLEMKFGWQSTVALALLDGRIGIDSFTDERRFRPDVEALLPRIRVVPSAEIPTDMHEMWVEVEVELESGRRLSARCDGPKGYYGKPKLDRETHLGKVRDCLGTRLPAESIERCIGIAETLEERDAREVGELIRLAGGCERQDSPGG